MAYPYQSNNTLLYVILLFAAIAGAYYYVNMKPVDPTPPPITAAELAAYMQNITAISTGTSTVKALSSGTGDRSILMQMFPQTQLKGWDAEGRCVDPTNSAPNADGSFNYIYMEDYTFFADETTASGFIVTDSSGAKQIPFAFMTNGVRQYYFQSFKVTPGTLMMITAYSQGLAPQTGFMLQGRDCRDVSKLLVDYPELTGGNNGIMWNNHSNDIHWTITTLNMTYFHEQLLKKMDTCLDTALGIGNGIGNKDDPQMKLGLHYVDGTRIASNIPGQPQMGRWIYDQYCNPIVDPKTNKQAYKTGGGGWGQSCSDAYSFCALNPGLLVGVELSQFDINQSGIPKWIGTGDIDGGIAQPPTSLNASQLGWMPSVTIAPPANAAAILSTPAAQPGSGTGPKLGSKSTFQSSRLSMGSASDSSSFPKGTSNKNSSHHSGHSYFSAHPTSMRYATLTS